MLFSYLTYPYLSIAVVHIISGDLTLHKRTLGPLSQLVYGLRRYDVDRCKVSTSSLLVTSIMNSNRYVETDRHSQGQRAVRVSSSLDL